MTDVAQPLHPGDRAPAFTLEAANRDGLVSLADYPPKQAVLLGLFRGLHCPFCRRQVFQLGTVQPALAALGVEQLFWRLAVQPGRPTWCGLRDGKVVVGLPGNPLSVMVGLELLLLPALRRLAGAADAGPRTFRLPLTESLRQDPQRLRIRPVRVVEGGAEPLGADLSHQLARAAIADALALVPTGSGELAAGSPVELIDLR